MKKLKSGEPRDRLSELPDSLIFNIFDFLLMTDVVRTAILSHRWRNLWTTAPNLNFDYYRIDFHRDKFRNFVNGALLRWRGTRIHKFKVVCSYNYENPMVANVDLWVRFAIDNGVEDLYIDYCKYHVPQCLYSCSSLKKLCLELCHLKINGNVEWKLLKSLTIIRGFRVIQHVINQILCGSPLLEVFKLSFVLTHENLSFRSSSLKELSIYNCEGYDSELRIWTPNLETLTILGSIYSKYLLENVSSLTHATLGFHCKDFIGFPFHDMLPSIQQVESITLSDWPNKMIGTKRICRLPNVKFLKLGIVKEHKDILRLLENFPNLKTLVLQEKQNGTAECRREYKLDDPSGPFLTNLTTVEITCNVCDFSIFPLLETLLKYANKLEKMVFRVKEFKRPSPPSSSLLLASQKLLRMRRSSVNAELIFCED